MGRQRKTLEFDVTGSGCFLVTSHKANGAGYIQINIKGKPKYVHRFVYEEMFGFIPEGLMVRHKCDVTKCINPQHMELGTQQDNIQDRQDRNRQANGSRMNTAKLTEMEVLQMASLFGRITDKELAKLYNVTVANIGYIRRGWTWSHVTGLQKTKK